jgi:U3 small nucleolar RNA-associated protein 21
MQSGIQRKTYALGPCPPEVAARFYSGTVKRSDRSISGLATDSLNSVVIANTLDGTLNVGCTQFIIYIETDIAVIQFFDFQTTKLEYTLVLPSSAPSILLHRDNGLLAIICDDMVVRIVDIETRRIVRELTGFHSRVLDIVSHVTVLCKRLPYEYTYRLFPLIHGG